MERDSDRDGDREREIKIEIAIKTEIAPIHPPTIQFVPAVFSWVLNPEGCAGGTPPVHSVALLSEPGPSRKIVP